MTTKPPRLPKVQKRRIDYTSYAKEYDEKRFAGGHAYYEWLRQRALARAMRTIPTTASLLDVGCGTGRGLVSLSEVGFNRVTGLDFTEDMLLQAAAKIRTTLLRGTRLVRGDAFGLPFKDRQFDVVTSFNFLHMFEYRLQKELVIEMQRVARVAVVVELESIHKGLFISRYPEQWRVRSRTKFNSWREVSGLFGREHFRSYRVVGSVLPVLHRWLKAAPRIGGVVDSVTALPLVGWLASRVLVVGELRR
jgi:ubiquinone/menaquinone biosynthesis C-methylase UbiE